MTREELVEIMYESGYRCREGAIPIADRILAALEAEKKGEVVLGPVGTYEDMLTGLLSEFDDIGHPLGGKRGQLIFREGK
jgi:hypothetical protein